MFNTTIPIKLQFYNRHSESSRGQLKFVSTKGRPEGITKGFRTSIVKTASQTKSNVILNQIVKTLAAKTKGQ